MGSPLVCIFDLGNVMVFHHEDRFFAKLAAASRPGAPVRELFYAAFGKADPNRGGDFDRVYVALIESVGLHMCLDEFRLAWNDIFTPHPQMVALVRDLARPRVLLSNTHEPHATWIKQRFPEIFPLFDWCVLSHEVGLTKPEPEIYRHVQSLTGELPDRHLLFDDRWDNVAGARAVGWQALQFTSAEDCERQLAALGLL